MSVNYINSNINDNQLIKSGKCKGTTLKTLHSSTFTLIVMAVQLTIGLAGPMQTVHSPLEVGWALSRHRPACCRGPTNSTRPAGIPRTTSQLQPSSGSRNGKASSGSSSSLTSRPSERASSSARFSAACYYKSSEEYQTRQSKSS